MISTNNFPAKILIVYSSRTGNTRRVAQALLDALPAGADLFPLAKAPDPAGYDLVLVGFWAKRGGPNPAAKAFLERLAGAKLALFGTMGARVGSPHAEAIAAAARRAAAGNTVLGVFLCSGRVDPAWLEYRTAIGKAHPMTAERAARLAEVASHPDAEDLQAAGRFARDMARAAFGG